VTTQQFKWIDRDTAARDLLQLVYHAPPQIAERAVKLLKAVRSPAIIPELKAMFLDPKYGNRMRTEIYRAICATPGNFDLSEFESIMTSEVFGTYNFYPLVFRLLKHHPNNLTWMIDNIESKTPSQQLDIYMNLLEFFPDVVTEPILNILTQNEDILSRYSAFFLHKKGGERIQSWLHNHMNDIVFLWLNKALGYGREQYWNRDLHLQSVNHDLDAWPELREALNNIDVNRLLKYMENNSVDVQRYVYLQLLMFKPDFPATYLLGLYDDGKLLLDLETAALLHQYGDETVQLWLKNRWDELLYLCLISGINVLPKEDEYRDSMHIVHVLESWAELKAALFVKCPAIIEEYEAKKVTFEKTGRVPPSISDSDIQASPIWQDLEKRRAEYIASNETLPDGEMFSSRENLIAHSEADIPKVAAEVYFLSTLTHIDHYASSRLWQLLRDAGDIWRQTEFLSAWDEIQTFSHTPIRFEAAYALRHDVSSSNWIMYIEVFLIRSSVIGAISRNLGDEYFLRWISRMTDILSGVEPELPDEEISLTARPWFRALVKQTQNEPIP